MADGLVELKNVTELQFIFVVVNKKYFDQVLKRQQDAWEVLGLLNS